MSAIFTRSALMHWGKQKLPPEVAYVTIDHRGVRRVVTWSDVMDQRREKQRCILEWKRHVEEWRAVKIWVAYFDQDLMGGWHAFVEDWRGEHGREWIDRDRKFYIQQLMKMFPLVEPGLFDRDGDQWHQWKIEFARKYRRRMQCRRPVGVVYAWRKGTELALVPEREN